MKTGTIKSQKGTGIFKKLTVPMYNAQVWLIINDAPEKELANLPENLFGASNLSSHARFAGACVGSIGGGLYVLIFNSACLTPENLAHEIFHLVHKMLSWRLRTERPYVDAYHGEHGAMLMGYLMDVVCREAGLAMTKLPAVRKGNER